MSQPFDRLKWQRKCGSGACLEWADAGDQVFVRSSFSPQGPFLRLRPARWYAFVASVGAGTLDRPGR